MIELEKRLRKKAAEALERLRGLRRERTEDIFTQRYLISPEELVVENYPRRRPLAAFNPGAVLRGDEVLIFPRLIFDYYSYTSSIGVFSLPVEDVLSGKFKTPLRTRIVIWPQYVWESVKGCEDPRIYPVGDGFLVLYTGVGVSRENSREKWKPVLAYAELDEGFEVLRKGVFKVTGPDGTLIPSNKDSAILWVKGARAGMLTRPSFTVEVPHWLESILTSFGLEPPTGSLPDLCWRAVADLRELTILEETLEPVLVPEPWEYKVGWSTNAVRLSEDQYLVGWHGVLMGDRSYRNGLAKVDAEGKLVAISDYLLAPKGLAEEYGDRSLTIFGNGLLIYGNKLIWVGGVSDYAIGVFVAELEDVLRMLREP